MVTPTVQFQEHESIANDPDRDASPLQFWGEAQGCCYERIVSANFIREGL